MNALLTLLLLCLAGSAFAVNNPSQDEADTAAATAPSYYRWVDASGKVHFSDKPPVSQQAEATREALTPAPELGTGKNVTQIYQKASRILSEPADNDSYENEVSIEEHEGEE